MLITIKSDHTQEQIYDAIEPWFRDSRFTLEPEMIRPGKTRLKLSTIRLKDATYIRLGTTTGIVSQWCSDMGVDDMDEHATEDR